jgi:hypothetical protein
MNSRLVSFEEAAEMLQLHHTTIRQRKGGTEMLTHVAGLGRRKFLVRAEVEALVAKVIKQSEEQDGQRKGLLRLAS